MYSSVKNIGQKEKKKLIDKPINDENGQPMVVNAIAGGNKKKRKMLEMSDNEDEDGNKSVDTDDISSDSDIDQEQIQKALDNFKKTTQQANVPKPETEVKSKSLEEADKERATVVSRPTKYVHVNRREEIRVIYFN